MYCRCYNLLSISHFPLEPFWIVTATAVAQNGSNGKWEGLIAVLARTTLPPTQRYATAETYEFGLKPFASKMDSFSFDPLLSCSRLQPLAALIYLPSMPSPSFHKRQGRFCVKSFLLLTEISHVKQAGMSLVFFEL